MASQRPEVYIKGHKSNANQAQQKGGEKKRKREADAEAEGVKLPSRELTESEKKEAEQWIEERK